MVIVAKNLLELTRGLSICDPILCEEFSIRVRLDRKIRRMRARPETEEPISYGSPYEQQHYFNDLEHLGSQLLLKPGENALACSLDVYKIPNSHFGMIQTKGSLARLFVSVTCNDGQVEPGYNGKITLEISNHATFPVCIPAEANIAQMFLWRCGTNVENPYNGKYQFAQEPTLASFP